MRGATFALGLVLLAACSDPKLSEKSESSELKQTAPTPVKIEFPVPQDLGPQVVHVVTRDIPAGGEIPWHTHPGVEIAYLESGEGELLVQGKGPKRLKAGDTFFVPRGIVHAGSNPGKEPLRLVITYVVDRDAPLRSPADPPEVE